MVHADITFNSRGSPSFARKPETHCPHISGIGTEDDIIVLLGGLDGKGLPINRVETVPNIACPNLPRFSDLFYDTETCYKYSIFN